MNKRRKIFLGYTLLELLIVMAIFMVLGAMGVGGYIGTRETMMARENVQTILQNVRSAKLKAMLLEKGVEENWLYGIGIDFNTMSQSSGESRTFFKWCSPFKDFGNDITKSEILGWDSSKPIGDITSQELDPEFIIPVEEPKDPIIIDDPDPYPSVEEPKDQIIIDDPDPSDVLGVTTTEYKNAYLPLFVTSSCQEGATSLTYIEGDFKNEILDTGVEIELISDAKYIVFEAITGRAFLYNAEGKPVNYEVDGDYIGDEFLDILIRRKRSAKFDLITIYPSSGTVIHHVYSNADKVSECTDNNCVTFDGKIYDRYDIADEINSYRD